MVHNALKVRIAVLEALLKIQSALDVPSDTSAPT